MNMAQIVNHGLHAGQMLKEARLSSDALSLSLLNIGAVTRDLRLFHKGEERSLVLGYADPVAYLENPAYLGVMAGRVAGRIKNACFELDGALVRLPANENGNLLHGGAKGLSHVLWDITALSETQARLTYHSPPGRTAFPPTWSFR